MGNENVPKIPKIIINDTKKNYFWTTVSILVISNHNSFWVPLDKIASVYFIGKIYLFLALEMASQKKQHCANCIGTLSLSCDTTFLTGALFTYCRPSLVWHFCSCFVQYFCGNRHIDSSHNSTQLNEHVRTQVLTSQCPHLFNTTTCETTHLLLHVLIYFQFRSGRLCNHTRYPGASKTCLNML